MSFNPEFWGALLFTIVFLALSAKAESWAWKLVFFIVGLGAAQVLMILLTVNSNWILVINAVLFGLVGWGAVTTKKTGNLILGVLFIVVAVASILAAFDIFGFDTPRLAWENGWRFVTEGLSAFFASLRNVFGGT